MNKAYKFRLYPNKNQSELIKKTFGCTRFVWNQMLSDKQEYYKENKKTLNITPAFYKKEFEWLKDVDSLALANVQLNLKNAYSNFFKSLKKQRKGKKSGFPNFKSKKKSRDSYTTYNVNHNIRIVGKHIRLPKLGLVKVELHRDISKDYIIKSATISKNSSGKYYISVLTEYHKEINYEIDNNKITGIDFSMTNLYVNDKGEKTNPPKPLRTLSKKLTRKQRRYNQKISAVRNKYLETGKKKLTKESTKLFKDELKSMKNLERKRKKIAVLHEKISNTRKDFCYKEARKLTNQYDILVFEDINLQNMSRCLNFGKSVSDLGFAIFRNRIQQICSETGKIFFKVDKWFPSSKLCNVCGYKNTNLKLEDREWICPECNTVHDRDINAGKNLVNYYRNNNTVGTTEIYASGDCTSGLVTNVA